MRWTWCALGPGLLAASMADAQIFVYEAGASVVLTDTPHRGARVTRAASEPVFAPATPADKRVMPQRKPTGRPMAEVSSNPQPATARVNPSRDD